MAPMETSPTQAVRDSSAAEGRRAPEGPALVLVHGAGGGAWEWATWSAELAPGHRVVDAVELQPTSDGLARTGLADYRRQVSERARAHGAGVVLVGASMGGILAASVADEVAADMLVLVSPVPPVPWNRWLARPDRQPGVIPWGADRSIATTATALPDADPDVWEFAAARWRDESVLALDEALRGVAVRRPRCPVLVIAGTADVDVPWRVSQRFARAWEADYVELAGVSHVGPLLGRSARFAARVAEAWISRFHI